MLVTALTSYKQKLSSVETKKETLPLGERPGFLIRRVHQIHSAIFHQKTQDFNVTPIQYAVLTMVDSMPNIDQHSLGKYIGMDRTNVADVLFRLSKRGFLTRSRSEKDKRVMMAKLTPEGKKIKKAMYHSMIEAQDKLLEPLSEEERDLFITMLVKLIAAHQPDEKIMSTLSDRQYQIIRD